MTRRNREWLLTALILSALGFSGAGSAQTFNGSATNTAGNSLIPSTGSGGCGIAPQSTGGTVFNAAVAGLAGGQPAQSLLVNFTHSFDNDVDMYLRAPNGQVLELSTDNGGAGDNFTNTVFIDSAATSITAGTPPFTGNFRPEGTLTPSDCNVTITPTVTTMGGFAPGQNGNWQLVILDDLGGDTGTMLNWSLTFAPAANADLAVVLSDTPDPVAAGSNISYTATLTNTGPGDATNASVSLPIPAGTAFVSATADGGGTCTNVSPITCTWAGTTANAVVRTATVVVSVPANAVNGSLINAAVTATSGTTDPDPADNTSTTGTAVITAADLSLTLTDTPDPVTAGAQLTYTATLANGGPSDAQNARFSVNIPAGTSFVSATPVGGSCAGTTTVTCTWAGATAPGVSRSASIVVAVPANAADGSLLDAAASATSDTSDPAAGNNNANATTTVVAQADLSLTLTDAPDPVIAGNQLTYTATLSNAGPSDAQDATISLPLPAGTSPFSAGASAGGTCTSGNPSVCTWAGATAPGVTRTATFVVTVNSSQTADLSATATASSSTTDPVPGNNAATATTVVQVQADLSITLTDAPDPVTAGTQLTYTATVTNAGPSDATAVVVNLPTPTGTSFVSGTVTGGGSCAAGISCTINGSMVPGSSRTLTITVLVAASVLEGTVINATATVTAGSPDPNGGNNSASTTTNVITRADLAVSLTSSVPQVLINVPVTFTAVSSNNGPSDAQNVSVTVTLTPDFRYSGHTATGASCTTPQIGNTGAIVCTWAGATAPGATRTLTVVAYSNVEGNTAVNANTTSTTTDPVPGNNNASLSVVVGYPFNEIPTLSQYGLVLLGLLLGLLGFVAVRRQG